MMFSWFQSRRQAIAYLEYKIREKEERIRKLIKELEDLRAQLDYNKRQQARKEAEA